jgi:ABC-type sugar transport system permease subunit
MRLDMKRERELARRKGNAMRTVFGVMWLAFSIAVAYLVTQWLIDTGTLTLSMLRSFLFIPPTVEDRWIRAGAMVIIVVAMQMVTLIVVAFGSRTGRRRPGKGSMYSREPDPESSRYDYR